jgi:hypothetical protein
MLSSRLIPALLSAALLLPCGRAAAESKFILIPPSSTPATGTADVNVRVVMPTLILLRVGSSNATGGGAVIDTLNFNLAIPIPGGVTALADGNNLPSAWNGSAPVPTAATQQLVNVSFYSNAANNRINCSIGAWTGPPGGPSNSDIIVATAGTIPHPGANLGACVQTAVPRLLNSATWSFTLGGNSAAWPNGTYSNVVTYTASTL